jgi:hypothetical protein
MVKRLVECYLIFNEFAVAEKYLDLLASSPVNSGWANQYRKYLDCPDCIANDENLGPVQKMQPRSDFFVTYNDPYKNLLNLMNDSVVSKMAFEYYIAYELLRRNPTAVLEQIQRFKQLQYNRLPTACQEAILLYKATKGIKNNADLLDYGFDEQVMADFNRFSNIIFNQFKGNFSQAKSSLGYFQHTFWYYFIYKNNENPIISKDVPYQE